jgi:predicted nucleic acid-binding protein
VAAYFFDSSALVKRYVQEAGTPWVQSLLSPSSGHDIHVLRITEVEVVSAVVRRSKSGALCAAAMAAILAQIESDFTREYRVLRVSNRLLTSSVLLVRTHELRAYDGVQLAGAMELNRARGTAALSEATLVSADHELNMAATAEGLTVEDPNAHP